MISLIALAKLINLISWSHDGSVFRAQLSSCSGTFLQKKLMAKSCWEFSRKSSVDRVLKCASASCTHGEIILCHKKRLVSRDNILNVGKNFDTFCWN